MEASMVKEFTTAIRDVVDGEELDEEGLPFEVDGVSCVAYRPAEGQMVMLMASFGRHAQTSDKIAGIIDFFVETLDEESQRHVISRLMDRNDPFGITEVEEIMAWMIEEWSGRPTQRSSGSPQSRRRTGPKSTLRTSA